MFELGIILYCSSHMIIKMSLNLIDSYRILHHAPFSLGVPGSGHCVADYLSENDSETIVLNPPFYRHTYKSFRFTLQDSMYHMYDI